MRQIDKKLKMSDTPFCDSNHIDGDNLRYRAGTLRTAQRSATRALQPTDVALPLLAARRSLAAVDRLWASSADYVSQKIVFIKHFEGDKRWLCLRVQCPIIRGR